MTKAERAALRALEAKVASGPVAQKGPSLAVDLLVSKPHAPGELTPGEWHASDEAVNLTSSLIQAAADMRSSAAVRNSTRALLDALDDADVVIKAARAWKKSAYGIKADDDLFRAVVNYDAKHGGE